MAAVRWGRIVACWLVVFGIQVMNRIGFHVGWPFTWIVYCACLVVVLAATPARWVLPRNGVNNLLPDEVERALVEEDLSLDSYKVYGTHNSTHQCNVFGWLFVRDWTYSHTALLAQLDNGIRHLEVDTWYNCTAGEWQVKHENLLDDLTVHGTPETLHDTLLQLASWCESRPDHFPLLVNLDIKGGYHEGLGWAAPLIGRGLGGAQDYTQQAYAELQRLAQKMWRPERLFTPREITGRHGATLRNAVESCGWPSVAALKGKTLLFLNLYGTKQHAAHLADSSFFFIRGHDFANDSSTIYYECNYDLAAQRNCISRSLNINASANLISVNDLTSVRTSIHRL
eukprot:TRINITY_DN34976_c0_g1_i1.p1 TRINITY_DN34976_c0_g1~~TRINITY_DN34976_c0_g1_i1.p1  ORF type:complete len:341 (+),score=55.41 TRINITY_DN34976_c0_g1_i1:47-1069(+)